ncbi:hypothetical protein GA0061102_102043 [Rhizobium miluonense]|uniref:Uncharacterized protein n=1 Tax=Rhizobium miluonense TaxID=411945 RepID=A0A1C3VZA6_9HYPH|nr:hypothetical protein GA0061102_102043 [Rhizobium miluonense]
MAGVRVATLGHFRSHFFQAVIVSASEDRRAARAFPLFFESRKRSIFLFPYAFRTENRCALFLEML